MCEPWGYGWVLLSVGFAVACQNKTETTTSEPLASASAALSNGAKVQAATPTPSAIEQQPTNAPPANGAQCDALCRRSSELKCKLAADKCKANCSEMLALPICRGELSKVFLCLEKEPVDHFECDEDGMPAVRTGFCEREQEAFTKCVAASGAAGMQ